jgi:hypothetical protein
MGTCQFYAICRQSFNTITMTIQTWLFSETPSKKTSVSFM